MERHSKDGYALTTNIGFYFFFEFLHLHTSIGAEAHRQIYLPTLVFVRIPYTSM